MADHVDNLVLEHLRGLRAQGDLVLAELREVKHRLTALETAVISVRRDAVQTDAELARRRRLHGLNLRRKSPSAATARPAETNGRPAGCMGGTDERTSATSR